MLCREQISIKETIYNIFFSTTITTNISIYFFSMNYIVSGPFIFNKNLSIFETIKGFPFSHISWIWILDAFWIINQLWKLSNIWKYSIIQNFHNLQNCMKHWKYFILWINLKFMSTWLLFNLGRINDLKFPSIMIKK